MAQVPAVDAPSCILASIYLSILKVPLGQTLLSNGHSIHSQAKNSICCAIGGMNVMLTIAVTSKDPFMPYWPLSLGDFLDEKSNNGSGRARAAPGLRVPKVSMAC